jgi:glycine/D-amino acid oxidase-like deaminating enzyme
VYREAASYHRTVIQPVSAAAYHTTRIVVVGAGAFGGWTALELRRRGVAVTLLDAWGPGNARASSGGETRIIRATYGQRAIYTRMTLRALDLWRDFDTRRELLRETGVLWMFGEDDSFGHESAAVLAAHGASFDPVSLKEAAARYRQVSFDGVRSVFFERDAGYLFARRACELVVSRFVAEGGEYRQANVAAPVVAESSPLSAVTLGDDTRLEADAFVFACGPWLPALFPDVIGRKIKATRQDVFYFGTPAGKRGFSEPELPVWMDFAAGSRAGQIYGIPASGVSGFKVADDAAGPAVDPSRMERIVDSAGVARARAFLAIRFPALADAPLVGSEVCQYESTPDDHFIVDRHPGAANVWIVGGGSGHGFKMGPALGELVASLVLGERDVDEQFGLARFRHPPLEGWRQKWE